MRIGATGLGVGLGLGGGGSIFCTEYQAIYDSYTTKPSAARAASENARIVILVDEGIWDELDVFCWYASHINTNSEALINIKNPGTNDSTLVNSPAFTANQGFKGNGTDAYINTNYNPTTFGGKFTKDDAGIYLACYDNISENRWIIGGSDGASYVVINPRTTADIATCYFNANSSEDIPNTDSAVHLAVRRTSSSNIRWTVDKSHTDDGNNSTTLLNANIYALCLNNNGTPATFTNRTLMYLAFGGNLTDAQTETLQEQMDILFFLNNNELMLTTAYQEYIKKADIDNDEANYIFDEGSLFPRYASQAFVSPAPMDETVTRRNFPTVSCFGSYSYMTYLAGSTHSISALNPHVLEFARSGDKWETSEQLPVKCILDGTMREIIPNTDGFFVNQPAMTYANGKLWMIIPTFDLTTTPPVLGSDWTQGKTYITYSSDNGDTWSELIELDTDCYVASSEPIVVGSEIWFTGYSISKISLSEQHCYILRYNFDTDTVGTKTRIDTSWTDLGTTEPAILEYATGKYMCIARVNWNGAYSGAETSHKGSVIAYSSDGLDWNNYTYYDEGSNYPNQPRLFMYKGYVYYSRGRFLLHGTVATDGSEIEWIARNTEQTYWYQNYVYTYNTFYGSPTGYIDRYDPRDAYKTEERSLLYDGSVSLCVFDGSSDTLFATQGFRISADDGYLGEPWLCVVKRNSVGSGPTYTERLLYMTEIPGDDNNSNEITIYNYNVAAGDTINTEWLNVEGKPATTIAATPEAVGIKFVSGAAVVEKKIVYEIIKA